MQTVEINGEQIPRRACLQHLQPIESAARALMQDIEDLGADPLLTEALELVDQARERLADFIEGVDSVTEATMDSATRKAHPKYSAMSKYQLLDCAKADLTLELQLAFQNWPEFNSAHEGFAVLLEEVDELKAHVWTNQKKRDIEAMRDEAIQVAAMATRFAIDVCNEEVGRK